MDKLSLLTFDWHCSNIYYLYILKFKRFNSFEYINAHYVSKDLVRKASDLGYLVGPYDSYHSIHKPGEEKWSTASFKDKSLYEKATIENKKGDESY